MAKYYVNNNMYRIFIYDRPDVAWQRCGLSPARYLAECSKRRLNQGQGRDPNMLRAHYLGNG